MTTNNAAERARVTEAELSEWERLSNAATPGPWGYAPGDWPHRCDTVIVAPAANMTARSPLARLSDLLGKEESEPDATFIAASREAVPRLISEVRALASERDALKEECERMRTAAAYLSNEVLGSLPLMEPLARREFGNTNYHLLIQRAEELRAALTNKASES